MTAWRRVRHLACAAALAAAAACPLSARAQHITIDGSLSPAQTLTAVGGTYTIGAGLGQQLGGNLFHSFGLFGLATGETANFTGPTTVANIIGRVTGRDLDPAAPPPGHAGNFLMPAAFEVAACR